MLEAEVEERERNTVARRIREAHFPKVKTLEEFEFSHVPCIPATLVRHLAEGGYLSRSEPVILLGEAGTGKTHLAVGLGVAACRQRRRVRFTTAAQLVNELIEAKNKSELNRVTNRWTSGTSGGDRDHELAVLGMDDDVSECEVVQGDARPLALHNNRNRNQIPLTAPGGQLRFIAGISSE